MDSFIFFLLKHVYINTLSFVGSQKQTPWPLILKRTIPNERPALVDEIWCPLLPIEGCSVVSAADPARQRSRFGIEAFHSVRSTYQRHEYGCWKTNMFLMVSSHIYSSRLQTMVTYRSLPPSVKTCERMELIFTRGIRAILGSVLVHYFLSEFTYRPLKMIAIGYISRALSLTTAVHIICIL
jgi:hypothetical protein